MKPKQLQSQPARGGPPRRRALPRPVPRPRALPRPLAARPGSSAPRAAATSVVFPAPDAPGPAESTRPKVFRLSKVFFTAETRSARSRDVNTVLGAASRSASSWNIARTCVPDIARPCAQSAARLRCTFRPAQLYGRRLARVGWLDGRGHWSHFPLAQRSPAWGRMCLRARPPAGA